MSFTIGSLFDGSGGFPLAAFMCGGTPVWASEIEPYPIAVTKTRFPYMKHLGSVTDIKGNEIEPVDVITFGSPCQDLSVAGKRAGLKHTENGDEETTRSGLFMDAVRIIKEMREATNGKYPRFAVWENVPGAFSSNKGEDFRIVLQELIQIAEPTAVMPAVPKNGRPYADSYCGEGWSLAYRVYDAQYWGVPQRRRRIYLVADFRGECAGKVSFERDGLRGYFEEGGSPWQGAASDAEGSVGADDCRGSFITLEPGIAAREGGHIYEGVSGTLRANAGDNQMAVAYSIENHPADSRVNLDESGKVQTLTSRMGTGGGNVPMVMEPVVYDGAGITSPINASNHQPGDPCHTLSIDRADTAGCNGKGVKEDICYTLNTIDRPAVAYSLETFHCTSEEEKTTTLKARDYKDPVCVAYGVGEQPIAIDRAFFNQGQNALYDPQFYQDGTVPTLVARGPSAVQIRYIVRRLTPTECARLQGFPDTWGHPIEKTDLTDEEYQFWLNVRNTHAEINGKAVKEYTKDQMLNWYNKLHTDSAEYKLWGNGISLPNALYIMQGISDVFCKGDKYAETQV